MSSFNVTNAADKLIAPEAWDKQAAVQRDVSRLQRDVSRLTEILAQRQADLDRIKPNVRSVLGEIVARAGGSLPENEEITGVVVNDEDGSVTIATDSVPPG